MTGTLTVTTGDVVADCRALATGILGHIANDLLVDGRVDGRWGESSRGDGVRSGGTVSGDPGPGTGRDFYGGAFALWLAELLGTPQLLPGLEETVRAAEDPPSGRYHTEFVLFALGMRAAASGDPEHRRAVTELAARRRFAYGRVANWRLLRSAVRLLLGGPVQVGLAAAETASVLAGNTCRSGFVQDRRGDPSMQYHAFSVFLLGHLSEHGMPWCRGPFRRGVSALTRLALPSGEVNYLGRGALQSFGYASTVAALAAHHRLTGAADSLDLAGRVLRRLSGFATDDGALPLVCAPHPTGRDGAEPPSGWWSYNNHSDYVAFTGALLAHAAAGLARSDSTGPGRTGSGSIGPGSIGKGTAGKGASGPGASGPGTAGSGAAGSGTAGPGVATGPGVAAGPGAAGAGAAGTDIAGTRRRPRRRTRPVIPGTWGATRPGYHLIFGVPRPGVAGGQPFPFVERTGSFGEPAARHPFPLFGGEQESSDRYRAETLPLPLVHPEAEVGAMVSEEGTPRPVILPATWPRSLAGLLSWRIEDGRLIGVGRWGRFTRALDLTDHGFTVTDALTPREAVHVPVPVQLSLYRDGTVLHSGGTDLDLPDGVRLHCTEPLLRSGEVALSPGGRLALFRAPGRDLEPGQTLRVRTEVTFG